MRHLHRHKRPIYPWLCWLIVALLYLFQYLLLVSPSVLSDDLQASLNVKRLGVGILYSAFLYTYVSIQVPVGFIFDRFRSRNILLISSVLLMIGCFIFAVSHNVWLSVIGRMVMGLGGGFTFIGALYIGRSWFPVVMFPLIVGLTEAMSGVTEISLVPLLALVKNYYSWRIIFLEVTAIVFILAVLVFFYVREHHPERKISKKVSRGDFNLVLKNPIMWLLSFYVGFLFAFDMLFANMWGVTFLVENYHITAWIAAVESGMTMVGFTVGCCMIGWIVQFVSDQLLMALFAIIQFMAMLLLWYLHLSLLGIAIIVLIIGFASSSMVLAFNVVKKIIPENSYGLATGFTNMFFGGTGILISPIIGYIFESTKDANRALIPMILCSGLAVVCSLILKRMNLNLLPLKAQGG